MMSGVNPPDRATAEPASFRSRRVLETELAAPMSPIDAEPLLDGSRPDAAWVLVRLHTWPIGIVELDLRDGALSATDLSSGIWAAHASAISAHLAADGLPVPAALSPSGLDTPADVPCLASRRAFLGQAPRVTVVVPTADRPQLLAQCLRDLRALDYPAFEIIVVDNAPERSGAEGVVGDFAAGGDQGPIRYVVEPRPGSSIARNRGLLASDTAITAFVDADARVDRHWLAELVRPIAEDSRTACATGLILPAELLTRAQGWMAEWGGYGKGFQPRLYDLQEHRDPGPLYPYHATLFGSGQSMAFRTDVLRRLGGFDLALGIRTRSEGGEDVGALLDVVLSGHRIAYAPGAIVWHPDPREEAAFLRKLQSYGVGLTALLTRTAATHPGSAMAIAARVPAAARYFFGASSGRNERHSSSFPRWPVWIAELRGMAWGPFAYALSRQALRRDGRSRRRARSAAAALGVRRPED
jgi:GT2 family glycosyltransferase